MVGKALTKVVIAVSVAALGAAVIKNKYPELTKDVSGKTLRLINSIKSKAKDLGCASRDAFKDGYSSERTCKA